MAGDGFQSRVLNVKARKILLKVRGRFSGLQYSGTLPDAASMINVFLFKGYKWFRGIDKIFH